MAVDSELGAGSPNVPRMGWILVTNDDGVGSPALRPLLDALTDLGELRTVVPDRERSWIGKAITRFEPLRSDLSRHDGVEIHAVTGFPADCVQLGIHTLFEEPPSLVVSGINMGYNHGSAYLQGSGTVGAALEAAISGVPALAFSAGSASRPWNDWKRWVLTPEAVPMWRRLADIAALITADIGEIVPPRLVVNINMPDTADRETERRVTTVATVGYDRLFRKASDGIYVHDFGGVLRPEASLEGTDIMAAADEVISITAVQGAGAALMPTDLRAALD